MVLIDALSAIVLLGVWFFYFARYNRRKGATALHWVEACVFQQRPYAGRRVGWA